MLVAVEGERTLEDRGYIIFHKWEVHLDGGFWRVATLLMLPSPPPPHPLCLSGVEHSSLRTIQIARYPTCPGAEVTYAVILKGLAYLHIPS